jgi:hypothetical protein
MQRIEDNKQLATQLLRIAQQLAASQPEPKKQRRRLSRAQIYRRQIAAAWKSKYPFS